MSKQALASLNAALRRQCAALQSLRAKASRDEVTTRYEMGKIVLSIDEDAKGTYGARAVERVAEVMGCSAPALYRYAAVARTWSLDDMRELTARTNAAGDPLSWSHLVELARVPTAWRKWLERALDECWSAHRLSSEIGAELWNDDEELAEDTTRAALLEALKEAQQWNTRVRAFGAALDRLARSTKHPPEIEELLARALDVFGDTLRRTGEVVSRVREMAPGPRARGVGLEN